VWVAIEEEEADGAGANEDEIIEIEELRVEVNDITSLGVIILEFNQDITLPQEFIDVMKEN